MIGRGHLSVLLPQFYGQPGIAFQAYSPAFFREIEQGKHLACYLKDQGCVIEWEAFSDPGLSETIFADFFEVQI